MWILIVCVNTLYDIPSKSKKRELNKKKERRKHPRYICANQISPTNEMHTQSTEPNTRYLRITNNHTKRLE